MHHVVEVGARFELGGQLSRWRARLQDEDGLGGDARHDEGVGVLVVAERPRPVTAKVERPETDGSHLEGEAEDRPHPRLDGRRGESAGHRERDRVRPGQVRARASPGGRRPRTAPRRARTAAAR